MKIRPRNFFKSFFLFGRNRQQIRIEHKIPPRCFIMADFRLRESVKFFLIMWLCMNIYPYAEIFSLLYITCSVKSTKLSSSLKMSKVPRKGKILTNSRTSGYFLRWFLYLSLKSTHRIYICFRPFSLKKVKRSINAHAIILSCPSR